MNDSMGVSSQEKEEEEVSLSSIVPVDSFMGRFSNPCEDEDSLASASGDNLEQHKVVQCDDFQGMEVVVPLESNMDVPSHPLLALTAPVLSALDVPPLPPAHYTDLDEDVMGVVFSYMDWTEDKHLMAMALTCRHFASFMDRNFARTHIAASPNPTS
jgi:hypothetical protein